MYRSDREWADSYTGQVITILNQYMSELAVLSVASEEKDNKYATDFELQLSGGTIAVRLRRPKYEYRDLTIRAKRDSGAKTELAKIQEGHAFRYFYGWIDDNNKISEWILVDLNQLRAFGLLEKERPLISNRDGTYFISISVQELYDVGSLIEYQLPQVILPSQLTSSPAYQSLIKVLERVGGHKEVMKWQRRLANTIATIRKKKKSFQSSDLETEF